MENVLCSWAFIMHYLCYVIINANLCEWWGCITLRKKDVSSFRWSTDLCVFINYAFCLIHKGSEFRAVNSAEGVTAAVVAQSRQNAHSSTGKWWCWIYQWHCQWRSRSQESCHQSSCCGVFAATVVYSNRLPSDCTFCWKFKPGFKDCCLSKHDAQCEPKLRISKWPKLFYTSTHNLISLL